MSGYYQKFIKLAKHGTWAPKIKMIIERYRDRPNSGDQVQSDEDDDDVDDDVDDVDDDDYDDDDDDYDDDDDDVDDDDDDAGPPLARGVHQVHPGQTQSKQETD